MFTGLAALLAAGFFAAGFVAADFLAAGFFAAGFLVADFLAVDLDPGVFIAAEVALLVADLACFLACSACFLTSSAASLESDTKTLKNTVLQLMEFVQAALKLLIETLHLAIAKLVDFFEKLPYRILNLLLQAIKLLQRIIDQPLDLRGRFFELLVYLLTILSTLGLAFFAMKCLLGDEGITNNGD